MKLFKSSFMLVLVLLFTAGCTASRPEIRVSGETAAKPHQGHGPPPHAPAHGYRAKHQGHDMTFDTGLGVYVVVDLPETYFHNGLYLRLNADGQWMVSAELGMQWRPAKEMEVPLRLDTAKKKKTKGKKGKHKKKNKNW